MMWKMEELSIVADQMGDRARAKWAKKWAGLLCPSVPRSVGELGPHLTVWPGPRATSVPSAILIYPTVWPQCTSVTDRQT